MDTNIPNDLVTIQLAAETLGISVSYLKKLIAQGRIATYKLGEKRTFVSPSQIRMLTVPQQTATYYTGSTVGGAIN